jgi:two-component system, LytTR family, response regulator
MLWLGGSVLLVVLYTFVFIQTADTPLAEGFAAAVANVLPLALMAAATRAVLKSYVMHRPTRWQVMSHAGLAVGFATTWYATVLVLIAFFRGLSGDGYAVSGFSGPAFTWQVFQGLVLYALVAAVCYAVRGGREAATISFVDAPPPLERYLTRTGDEMRPVEVRDIVAITGAQDYSEVSLTDGRRHLVRMSLGEFERRLDPARFIRVHRSSIVAFAHLARVEPSGGGRMRAHLSTGESVEVSRAGAQTLRAFVV